MKKKLYTSMGTMRIWSKYKLLRVPRLFIGLFVFFFFIFVPFNFIYPQPQSYQYYIKEFILRLSKSAKP